MKNQIHVKCFAKFKKCLQCFFGSTEDRKLVFQEYIDNNKSIGVTIYRCQIQATIKFYKQAPQKVLIELSPGVITSCMGEVE